MLNRVYVLVEGDDDERFVKRIVEPLLLKRYPKVDTYQYAARPKKIVERFVNTARTKLNAELLCLSDMDNFPCITKRKRNVVEKKIGGVYATRVIVVRKKIEGWYLAGITTGNDRKIGIQCPDQTNQVNKTDFDNIVRKTKFTSRISCMIVLLDIFDIQTAVRRNTSFKYFYEKYLV